MTESSMNGIALMITSNKVPINFDVYLNSIVCISTGINYAKTVPMQRNIGPMSKSQSGLISIRIVIAQGKKNNASSSQVKIE